MQGDIWFYNTEQTHDHTLIFKSTGISLAVLLYIVSTKIYFYYRK